MADVSSKDSCFFGFSEPSKDVESVHLETMASFSLQEGSSPLVEELGFDLSVHVKPDQVLVLVILVNEIHSISIPSSKGVSFSLSCVISHNLDKLMDSFLQILHVLGTIFDFLQSIFGSHVECLGQDLEEKLGS